MIKKKRFWTGLGLVTAFAVWTVLLRFVDVQAIGPRNSAVGFATLNAFVHERIGVHMVLYEITDWLGLVPIAVAFVFAIVGLLQWIKRKSFKKVDDSILILGAFYLVVMAVYILFELVSINRRPVLVEGYLETSYPSSTTLLVACVMPSAMLQLRGRIRNPRPRRILLLVIAAFTVFMVIGRLVSGVHWLTDIIGAGFISTGLVLLYASIAEGKERV